MKAWSLLLVLPSCLGLSSGQQWPGNLNTNSKPEIQSNVSKLKRKLPLLPPATFNPQEINISGRDGVVIIPDLIPTARANYIPGYNRHVGQTGYTNAYPRNVIQFNVQKPKYLSPLSPLLPPYRPREINIGGTDGVLSPAFTPNVKPNWYNKLIGQPGYLNTYPKNVIQYNVVRPQYLPPLNTPYRPHELNIGGNAGVLSPNVMPSINKYNVRENQIRYSVRPSDDRNINNYVYLMNKTVDGDQQGQAYASMLAAMAPGGSSQYLVNENVENIRQSLWVPPHPIYPQPVPVNPYQNECDELLDIMRELRVITHTNNLILEKRNLKKLLWLLKLFIDKNNLQYSPFQLVLQELARALLREGDNNNLSEEEIVKVLEDFKNRGMVYFLHEIRSNPDLSLPVVVSKLAQLLHRLKLVLVQRRVPQEIIRLILNRAAQWSVPLVSYYFEKECKIKTQQYIVQNLETALDVNLGSVQHVGSLDELKLHANAASGVNYLKLDNVEALGSLENSGTVLGNQVNVGGEGGVGTVDSGSLGHLGGSGNQVNGGSVAIVDSGVSEISENIGGAENLEINPFIQGL